MSGFTSLAELPAVSEENPAFSWELEPPPSLDRGAIGVHVGRTLRLARLAGFKSVHVGEYQDNQTSYSLDSHSITGIGPDASITGTAKVTAAKVATERTTYRYEEHGSNGRYRMCNLDIGINRTELASRISNRIRSQPRPDGDTERKVLQEKAWAHELGRSLRRGITKGGKQKLRDDINLFSLIGMVIPTTSEISLDDMLFGQQLDTGVKLIISLATFHLVDYCARYNLKFEDILPLNRIFGDSVVERKPFSIVPFGMHVDRVAAAGVMSALPLVRRLKDAKKT